MQSMLSSIVQYDDNKYENRERKGEGMPTSSIFHEISLHVGNASAPIAQYNMWRTKVFYTIRHERCNMGLRIHQAELLLASFCSTYSCIKCLLAVLKVVDYEFPTDNRFLSSHCYFHELI